MQTIGHVLAEKLVNEYIGTLSYDDLVKQYHHRPRLIGLEHCIYNTYIDTLENKKDHSMLIDLLMNKEPLPHLIMRRLAGIVSTQGGMFQKYKLDKSLFKNDYVNLKKVLKEYFLHVLGIKNGEESWNAKAG